MDTYQARISYAKISGAHAARVPLHCPPSTETAIFPPFAERRAAARETLLRLPHGGHVTTRDIAWTSGHAPTWRGAGSDLEVRSYEHLYRKRGQHWQLQRPEEAKRKRTEDEAMQEWKSGLGTCPVKACISSAV